LTSTSCTESLNLKESEINENRKYRCYHIRLIYPDGKYRPGPGFCRRGFDCQTVGLKTTYAIFHTVIKRIPHGNVATYGQIARLAGLPGQARQVGYALHASPQGHAIPWHRVINAKGEISKRAEPVYESIQRELLEQEGIVFDRQGRISLRQYQWQSDHGHD